MGSISLNYVAEKSRRLIDIKAVMRKVPRSRSTIYRWMEEGKFPKQAKMPDGTISALWFENEVDAWIEERRKSPSPVIPSPMKGLPAQPNADLQWPGKEIHQENRAAKLAIIAPDRKRSRQRRSSDENNEIQVTLRPVQVGDQTVLWDSQTGSLFVVVGQLPMLKPGMVQAAAQFLRQTSEANGAG